MTAYRDDLEAAQLRADTLERDLAEVRARNLTLEQRLAVAEAPENTRRFEAAIEHERREREQLKVAFEHERRERERLETAERERHALALAPSAMHLAPAVARNDAGRTLATILGMVVVGCAVIPPAVATAAFVIGVAAIVVYALTHGDQRSRR